MVPMSATFKSSSLKGNPIFEAVSTGNLYYVSKIGMKSLKGHPDSQTFKVTS